MFLFGLQTEPHSSWPYLICWTSKFNIKKEKKYLFNFLTPFYITRLLLGGRTKVWCMKTWMVCVQADVSCWLQYMGIIFSIRVSQKCHDSPICRWLLPENQGNKHDPVKCVINIDSHCSNLHQHKLWVASKTRGCVSAVSPRSRLQFSCTGSQAIASAPGICMVPGKVCSVWSFDKRWLDFCEMKLKGN